ncbi:MAG: hypothetical protein GF417_05450 [Candidatus Latescibacteria bacterium]|nr:hypothetical protein [bacterium]MBD3423861.1 hypothetical protein [Candidatus Latescibacterota bacterium]
MPAGEKQPRDLGQYMHLFLSDKEEKREDTTVPAEYNIWLVFTGIPAIRALFASGVASFISSRGNQVTLYETGGGLPNSGYYFGLDPEEYLLPSLEKDASINRVISPMLRYACSRKPAGLKPFRESSFEADKPHFIISAFCAGSGTGRAFYERISERGSCYSERRVSAPAVPRIALIVNLDREGPADDLVKQVSGFAPGAGMLTTGFCRSELTEELNPGAIEPPDMNEMNLERRQPPSGRSFLSFMNSLLQKMSTAIRETGRTATG